MIAKPRVVAEGGVRTLWVTHGVPQLDLVVLGVELALLTALIALLWHGFTR